MVLQPGGVSHLLDLTFPSQRDQESLQLAALHWAGEWVAQGAPVRALLWPNRWLLCMQAFPALNSLSACKRLAQGYFWYSKTRLV